MAGSISWHSVAKAAVLSALMAVHAGGAPRAAFGQAGGMVGVWGQSWGEPSYLIAWIIVSVIAIIIVTLIFRASRWLSRSVRRRRRPRYRMRTRRGRHHARGPVGSPMRRRPGFFECPSCHNPDIENHPDGSSRCGQCGWSKRV